MLLLLRQAAILADDEGEAGWRPCDDDAGWTWRRLLDLIGIVVVMVMVVVVVPFSLKLTERSEIALWRLIRLRGRGELGGADDPTLLTLERTLDSEEVALHGSTR